MNTTPLSMIQEVLLNKKEGKKSKFTVEFEEREENGKSRVRIDIQEVDEKTPENDGSLEDKTPLDYGPREEFYRITPACDSDVSMRSVSENPPASDNLNTERAQSPKDSNRNEQLNERQDIEGGQYQPPEPFNSTNFTQQTGMRTPRTNHWMPKLRNFACMKKNHNAHNHT